MLAAIVWSTFEKICIQLTLRECDVDGDFRIVEMTGKIDVVVDAVAAVVDDECFLTVQRWTFREKIGENFFEDRL